MKIFLINTFLLFIFSNLFSQEIDSLNQNITNGDSSRNLRIGQNKDVELVFINALNFDFDNTSKSSLGYFGHLNYFFNLKRENSISKNYINTGLMKINYFSEQLNKGSEYRIDYVAVNPLRTSINDSITKQYNKYDYDISLSSYSGYFQYLRKIGTKYNSLFCHLHAEFMVTNYDARIKLTNISKELLDEPLPYAIPVVSYLENTQTYSKQKIGSYFGGGLTGKVPFLINNRIENVYFFQGTIGYNFTQLNPNLLPKNDKNIPNYESTNSNALFFLIHSYFENNFNAAKLLIGTQLRGDFCTVPFYTFYIGLNVNINDVKLVSN